MVKHLVSAIPEPELEMVKMPALESRVKATAPMTHSH
jgi:hypothetical protein